ncbi:MAG: Spy/CpxP family protein refolding chaperone [Desulfobacteraceae bacterium]|nr:Spy/CpxP family protein refolding chaperone [Desulfobacteraceae bacterium]
MDYRGFLLGFISAFIFAAAGLTMLCFYLKRIRNIKAGIKGYLDLIPDLTEEQRAEVREIRRTFLPRVSRIRENLRRERAELAKLLFADPPEREQIHAVARQILLHQSDLENEVIEHILEERELLSVSQQRKFYEIIVEQFASGGLGVHDVRSGKT